MLPSSLPCRMSAEFLLPLILIATGVFASCKTQSQASLNDVGTDDSANSYSSADSYQAYSDALAALDAPTKAHLRLNLNSTTLTDAYAAIAPQAAVDQSFTVDGYPMTISAQDYIDTTANVQALQQTYPTQGDLWLAYGIDPLAITQDQFTAAVQAATDQAAASSASLGLDDSDQFANMLTGPLNAVTKVIAGGAAVGQAFNGFMELAKNSPLNKHTNALNRINDRTALIQARTAQLTAKMELKTQQIAYKALMAQSKGTQGGRGSSAGSDDSSSTDSPDAPTNNDSSSGSKNGSSGGESRPSDARK